jgi:hypothetical protein
VLVRTVALILIVGLTACGAVANYGPATYAPETSTASPPAPTPVARVTIHIPGFAGVGRDELFAVADIVAIVRVSDRTDKAIGTDYVWRELGIEVIKSFKGPAFDAVQQPGGAVPGRVDIFEGLPYLETGREYLVFLHIGKIGDSPSVEFFGSPAQLAFVLNAGQYVSLDGAYKFGERELADLASKASP